MKCDVVRLRLLSAVDPAQTPADVRAHLARCEFCRDWHSDLVTFQEHVPYLPVPKSRGKAKLLRRLLREGLPTTAGAASAALPSTPVIPPAPSVTFTEPPVLVYRRLFTVPRVMAGLATVVLLVLGAWLARG